jgi:Putative peptidoglycan-binding domain-containing protein
MLLKEGNKGNDVKTLQNNLNILLSIKLVVDGTFGVGTTNAVKEYQRKNQLTSDGIVGDKTWNLMISQLNSSTHLAKVVFDSGVNGQKLLDPRLIDAISKAGGLSGHDVIYVSSGQRTPHAQASAMYANLIDGNNITYAAPGTVVSNLIKSEIKKKTKSQDIIKLAEAKIVELSKKGQRVSLHCVDDETYKKRNILDISKSRTKNPIKFINEMLKYSQLIKVITSTGSKSQFGNNSKVSIDLKEPAHHIEWLV